MSGIERAINLEDLRRIARRKLPPPLFHYIEGGADDEINVTGNTTAFENVSLVPEILVDVANVDLSTEILGRKITMPLLLSPTGMSRLFHYQGETAVSNAAAAAGTFYSLSAMASTSIEEVAAVCAGPKNFQIYVLKDRGLTREFIQRCKDSNYDALTVTVDVPVAGNRERDRRYGFTLPPKLTLSGMVGFATRPGWVFRHLTQPPVQMANVAHKISQGNADSSTMFQYVADQFDPSVTWDDVEWMISEWGGPFAIKGILSPRDAREAVEVGASAIFVSNHGGRQLDGTVAAFDALAPIADEVGGECEIICDGGTRHGTHVLKAMARGANACSIGRPYLYGLAAGGEAGVGKVLQLMKTEMERGLALLGCRNTGQIAARHIV